MPSASRLLSLSITRWWRFGRRRLATSGCILCCASTQDTIQLVVSGHLHRWIDYGHTYGPQHYVMAATRYDPNAYMLLEVDPDRGNWRFLNADLVEWSTHYSKPYHPVAAAS